MARNKNYISRLKRENEELKKDLRRAENMLELLTDMTTHMVEKLITDNESLENLNEHLHDAVHKMVYRNAELRRKLREQPAVEEISKLKAQKEILDIENEKLRKDVIKRKDDIETQKSGRRGLFLQNEELKAKTDVLTEKIKDLEAKAIEDQQELIAAYDKINKLRERRRRNG